MLFTDRFDESMAMLLRRFNTLGVTEGTYVYRCQEAGRLRSDDRADARPRLLPSSPNGQPWPCPRLRPLVDLLHPHASAQGHGHSSAGCTDGLACACCLASSRRLSRILRKGRIYAVRGHSKVPRRGRCKTLTLPYVLNVNLNILMLVRLAPRIRSCASSESALQQCIRFAHGVVRIQVVVNHNVPR